MILRKYGKAIIDQINDLKASNRRLIDMIDTLKQTLDSVTASNKRNEELVVKLTAQIDQLQKMVKNLEDKNQRHNKHTFGKSSFPIRRVRNTVT